MPSLDKRNLFQKAVLWTASSAVDDYGEPVVVEPVEINCRWLDRVFETVTVEGTPLRLEAEVIVGREVPLGSKLWKGTLESWQAGTGSAGDATKVMYVRTYRETPGVKNRYAVKKVGLSFSKDSPE